MSYKLGLGKQARMMSGERLMPMWLVSILRYLQRMLACSETNVAIFLKFTQDSLDASTSVSTCRIFRRLYQRSTTKVSRTVSYWSRKCR